MANIKSILESKSDFHILETAMKLSERLNYKVYIVGGYIRDIFIKKSRYQIFFLEFQNIFLPA